MSWRSLRLFVLVSVVCLCSAVAQGGDYETVAVFANGTEGYKIFRIPAIVRTASGDLLAFCEAREGGDASQIDLVLKRSRDGGRTWQALQIVQDHEDFRDLFAGDAPPITVGNPAPVVDPMRVW